MRIKISDSSYTAEGTVLKKSVFVKNKTILTFTVTKGKLCKSQTKNMISSDILF